MGGRRYVITFAVFPLKMGNSTVNYTILNIQAEENAVQISSLYYCRGLH